VACASAAVACTPTKPTEIVAGVTTQIQVPKFLKTVGVAIQKGGRLGFCGSYAVHDGSVTLPSTLGMDPADASASSEPLTVQVLGFHQEQPTFDSDCVAGIPAADAPGVLVIRRQRLPFAPERIVYLPMPLRESCSGVACPEDQTCIGGVCEDLNVDPASLSDYADALVFGDTNTCFSVSSCMPPWGLAPALIADEASCTFRVPWPDGTPPPEWGQLNVRVVYCSLGSEVLDLDPREGFTLPDPADPLTFALAPNLCESGYHAGNIVAVAATALCPSKRALQPICTDDLRAIQSGADQLGLAPPDTCVLTSPLQQAESALYVLMDRSASMASFFGPEGLQFVIETTLKNPIAARTQVAFSWLPADQSQCAKPATNDFFTQPTFGFGDVATLRQPIAQALADTSNLLPGDPRLELDAALSPDGAYGLLDGLQPIASQRFNRRAVLVIGNRDLQAACGGGPIATAAGEALAMGLHTYVVVLQAPPGAEQYGGVPLSDGGAIAAAGGTQVFDAVTDQAAGAKAVQDIVSDLGSCLYDAPDLQELPGNPSTLPTTATLSYVDPLTLSRVDIVHDSACSEGSSGNGWNQDADGVRVCGFDCSSLRDTLTAAALAAAQQKQPAPQVPLLVTLPCGELGL